MPGTPRRRLASGLGVFALIGGLLASGSYASLTLLAPLEPVAALEKPPAVAAAVEPVLEFPEYGGSAIAAIGYPDASLTHGEQGPMELASVTKVITVLVALEAKPLGADSAGPTLTFGAWDVERYLHHLHNNGSNEPVWSGLRLSQRQVLEAVLMSSANNYSESLAVWAFGSIDAFVTRASAWLAQHGLHDTRIVEPSGIDPRNVSTTSDLLTIAALALNEPVVADIAAQSRVSVPGLGDLKNSNRLLGQHGIDGIKTGSLNSHNLLFSADIGVGDHTVTVVGAVLGADSREARDASVRRLVESVSQGFEIRELVSPGTVVATYATPWGDEARAVASRGASLVAWRGSETTVALTVDSLLVGAEPGRVGRLDFTVGQRHVTVPVVLDGVLDDPGVWWRLTNPAELIH